ncbi:MAG: GxxExxY protein, partial [Calditrichia bacterium]|nr:GxxExxY protein [Calditrichia bacterium]
MEELNKITEKIIGCAIEVHRNIGPGLLESVYEKAMAIELKNSGLKFERQKSLAILYKNHSLGEFKIDILVENKVVVELKSVERHDSIFEAQLLSYLKLG